MAATQAIRSSFPLHQAIYERKPIADITPLVAGFLNARDNYRRTPLSVACEIGYAPAVQLLLKAGAPPEERIGKEKYTALHIVAIQGFEDLVPLLVASGAEVDAKSQEDLTPLLLACDQQKKEAAEALLRARAGVNTINADIKWTALHHTAYHNIETSLRLLLSEGANTNITDIKGQTPLYLAAMRGHEVVLRLLLAAGADPRICEPRSGFSPLHIAAQLGHRECVEALAGRFVQLGISLDLMSTEKTTALFLACKAGKIAVAECLLDAGAGVNTKNCDWEWTALHVAIWERWDTRLAQMLIEHHANVDEQASLGYTSLMLACQKGFTKGVKLLVMRGANLDLENSDYGPKRIRLPSTAIKIAAHKGFDDIVLFLGAAGLERERKGNFLLGELTGSLNDG